MRVPKGYQIKCPLRMANGASLRPRHVPAFGLIRRIDPGCTRRISRRSAVATRTNLPRMAKNANEVTLSVTRLPVQFPRTLIRTGHSQLRIIVMELPSENALELQTEFPPEQVIGTPRLVQVPLHDVVQGKVELTFIQIETAR